MQVGFTVDDQTPSMEHARAGEPLYPATQVPAAESPEFVSGQSAFWYPVTAAQVIPVRVISDVSG